MSAGLSPAVRCMTSPTSFRTLRIQPRNTWRLDLRELWEYRELLWILALRDIKVRYKQTVLGVLWVILQPLTAMTIFSLVFGHLAKLPSDGLPYPIFVFTALLPWTFFANAVTSAGNSVVGSANLISKVYFPRLIIPLASIGGILLDFAISAMILLIMMLFYGLGWSLNLLAAPVLVLALGFIALGVGTLLSALNVAYRDFRYVIPFLVQIWMFATPVVYPASLLPGDWRWLLYLNPMAGVVEGFRSAFLGRPFDALGLGISFIIGTMAFLAGVWHFNRVERRFADII